MNPPIRSVRLVAHQWLDRYELVRPLAVGGMAEIWLANFDGRQGFKKQVAIKAILPEVACHPMFRRMFLNEARVVARLDHPNVAQVFDLGEVDGRLYIAMEWIRGLSVAQLGRALGKMQVQFPLALALRVASELAGALHAAHELRDDQGQPLGVVHRDVSPENVLLTSSGCTKLIDFGIIKTDCTYHNEELSAGGFKGKLEYAAPEQSLGLPVDRRADVWAVGAVLYRMLTGRVPYEQRGQSTPVSRVAAYSKRAAVPSSIPRRIGQIIEQALAVAPEHRFDTCEQLQIAVDQAIASERLHATQRQLAAFITDVQATPGCAPTLTLVAEANASDEEQTVREGRVSPPTITGRRADITADRHWPPARAGWLAICLIGTMLAMFLALVLSFAPKQPPETQAVEDLAPIAKTALGMVERVDTRPRVVEASAVAVDSLPLEPASGPLIRRKPIRRQTYRK